MQLEAVVCSLSTGFNQESMEGLAVLSKFQSNFVKSILREIGVLGGAAKLNQVVFNSTDPEAVECLPPTWPHSPKKIFKYVFHSQLKSNF